MKVYNCRMCKGYLSDPKLQFPSTPLANEFLKEQENQDLFPLEVCICLNCGHYQLNESVDPERLFRNYLFVAGTSQVNINHFKKYAEHMVERFDLKKDNKVLDIASNDGILLQQFKNLGLSILGIDPAKNIADEANKNGIPTIPDFFTEEASDNILNQYGQFNLITANNVLAHVPDLSDFAKGVKKLLAVNGVFSFEVSYFADVVDKTLFDTIYHEHSSYHTVKPLISFFDNLDLELFDVERIPNHGGSIRVFVCHNDANFIGKIEPLNHNYNPVYSNDFCSCYKQEMWMENKVTDLQKNIKYLGLELREKLRELKLQNKSIAIYGVPAKATTLMYALDIDETMIDFAVDDAPLKQGTFTPGKHIPVLHPDAIYEKNPDYLLILAWNFEQSIREKHSKFNGKWIVPIPELKEY